MKTIKRLRMKTRAACALEAALVAHCAERARTDIGRLVFNEDPQQQRRHVATRLPRGSYRATTRWSRSRSFGAGSTADRLTGTAYLVEKPAGSGRRRLANEP